MESGNLDKISLVQILFIIFTVVLTGCSKDDEIMPSDGNDDILASKTIGSNGGDITIDSLLITIPAGSFNDDHEIEVLFSDKTHPFTNQEVTSLYQINGIPDDFSKPIKIALKYFGTLEDESYVAMGMNLHPEDSDTSLLVFTFLDTRESDGYLEAEYMPANQQTLASTRNNNLKSRSDEIIEEITIKGITKYKYKHYETSSTSFKIHIPTNLDSDPLVAVLPKHLDNYAVIYHSLMHVNPHFKFQLPNIVYVHDSKEEPSHGYWRKANYFYYTIESYYNERTVRKYNYFTYYRLGGQHNEYQLNLFISQALFHSFQCFIYERDIGLINDWFSDACGHWIEDKYFQQWENNENYVPDKLRCNELVPFNKWGSNSKDESMVPIIRYLIREYGNKVFYQYHHHIRSNTNLKNKWYETLNYMHIDKEDKTIEDPMEEWMPAFFIDYMEGKIYGVKGDIFVNGVKKDDYVDLPVNATPQSYTYDHYDDLSAKTYRFNTKDISLAENSTVEFSLESDDVDSRYLALLIFTYDRGNHQIKYVSSEFLTATTVVNIKDLQSENKDLLAVIVNCSKDINDASKQSSIALEVDLKQLRPLTYKRFTIWLSDVNKKETYQDGTIKNFNSTSLSFHMPESVVGKFTGEEFTADWNLPELYGKPKGFVRATVQKNSGRYVLSKFEIQYLTGSVDEGYTFNRIAEGVNIPLLENVEGNDHLYGIVESADIGNALTRFVWAVSYYNADKSLTDDSYVTTYEVTENSRLDVTFSMPD